MYVHVCVFCLIIRYEVRGCDVIWAIKDHAISHTFFDEGAATFFLPHLSSERVQEEGREEEGCVVEVSPFKRTKYALDKMATMTHEGGPGHEEAAAASAKEENAVGVALGPDWHENLKMTGKKTDEVRILFSNHLSIPLLPPPPALSHSSHLHQTLPILYYNLSLPSLCYDYMTVM